MLANATITVTPGSGATGATWSPSGTTEYHLQMRAAGTSPDVPTSGARYGVHTPRLGILQNSYLWELFNGATSGVTLWVDDIAVTSSSDVAFAADRQLRAFLFRTTALASGGTACTYESQSTLSANFYRFDSGDAVMPSTVTMKTKLTSITTGAFLGELFVALNETRPEDVLQQGIECGYGTPETPSPRIFKIPPGQGIACREGPNVASGGNTEFLLALRIA